MISAMSVIAAVHRQRIKRKTQPFLPKCNAHNTVGKGPLQSEGTRQLKSRVDALKLFCLLYIFCKFFSLLLKGHVVSTK